MGIIVRLYHRSEGLTKNRFNTFFMDMGENIHVHYRDLRIEFNVEEFQEFAELCETYIPLVRSEIAAGFREGVNPNTNQSDTIKTFFNKKPLKQTIVYNPTRISLEENTDGFHIHLRNYKILLDKESFLNFARAARDVIEMGERAVDLKETLNLIEVNELHHRVDEVTREGETDIARITIEEPYTASCCSCSTGSVTRGPIPTKKSTPYIHRR